MFDLFPKTIEIVDSPLNGQIKVVRRGKNISLQVGGYEQSGSEVEKIWSKALTLITPLTCKTILILGLGGGTLAQVVNKYFNPDSIVGVELDPQMVFLGKKYFSLHKVKNLNIKNEDAFNFASHNRNKFNLILVDLYIGKMFPSEVSSEKFLQSLSHSLSKNGQIIFNGLSTADNNFSFDDFLNSLKNLFIVNQVLKQEFNTFIFCTNS